jgi:hypothetical protein
MAPQKRVLVIIISIGVYLNMAVFVTILEDLVLGQ